jgi:hypothetical protein
MVGQGTNSGDATDRETALGSQAGPMMRQPATAGPPGPAPTITLEAIEVTQAIQDLAMSVPLIAGKMTIVRVYLGSSFGPIVVRASLRVTSVSDPSLSQSVARIADLEIDPGYNGQVAIKRQDIARSLNFIWPKDLCLAGDWTIALESLERIDVAQSLVVPAFPGPIVPFRSSPPLRVHVVGIRYHDGNSANTFEPGPLDFELLRSWLGRAYPVAEVVWSQVTVDFSTPWMFVAEKVNDHLRALRDADVQGGTDHRTHYYGIVADGGGKKFMRGLASADPRVADSSTVASGPTGVPRDPKYTWDTDGSYGDWYGGHELAHTFGREHANYCDASGGTVPYPYSNGQLFDDDTGFVGLDVGDAAYAIPMRALPGTGWHDIMTYCEYLWPSNFTYIGIRDRFLLENMLPPPLPPPITSPGGGMTAAGGSLPATATAVGGGGGSGAMLLTPSIHVVASVNLTQGTAAIPYVTPRPAPAFPPHPEALELGKAAGLELQLQDARGEMLWKASAPFVPDVCRDEEPADETGTVDMTAPNPPQVARIALLRQGKELAHFDIGLTPEPVHDIRPLSTADGRELAPAARPANPILTWSDHVRDQFVAAGAKPSAPDIAPTYLVQVSTDDRKTWRTIGLGLQRPQVTIDRILLRGADRVIVRVTSTDGVHAASQEKTFNAGELVPAASSIMVREGIEVAPESVDTRAKPISLLGRLTALLSDKVGNVKEVISWVNQPLIDPLPAVGGGSRLVVGRAIPIPASLIIGSDEPIAVPAWFDARTRRLSCPSDPSLEYSGAVRILEGRIEVIGSALPSAWQLFTVVSDSRGSSGESEVFALRRLEASEGDELIAQGRLFECCLAGIGSVPSGVIELITQGRLFEAWQAVLSTLGVDAGEEKLDAFAYMIWTQCVPLVRWAREELEQRFPGEPRLAALRQFRRIHGYLAGLRQSLLESWGLTDDRSAAGSDPPT